MWILYLYNVLLCGYYTYIMYYYVDIILILYLYNVLLCGYYTYIILI